MKWNDVLICIRNARLVFEKIKTKYPGIRAYLVFSNSHGQVEIDLSPEIIIEVFPEMFVEGPALDDALEWFDCVDYLGIDTVRERISAHVRKLEVKDDTTIELRWHEIDYAINNRLRSDSSLVDTALTPQIGGIRIVLGTLKDLYWPDP